MRFICDRSNCNDSRGKSLTDNHCLLIQSKSPGLLASATLSAIARFTIVHRAILASLLTAGLVCRESHCANRSYQDCKQDFEITLHSQPSLASIANASGKHRNTRTTGKRGACPTTIRPAVCGTNAKDIFHHHSHRLHEFAAAHWTRL